MQKVPYIDSEKQVGKKMCGAETSETKQKIQLCLAKRHTLIAEKTFISAL